MKSPQQKEHDNKPEEALTPPQVALLGGHNAHQEDINTSKNSVNKVSYAPVFRRADELGDVEEKHLFNTLPEAFCFIQDFYLEYDPRGYGSRVEISFEIISQKFVVETFRFGSCD